MALPRSTLIKILSSSLFLCFGVAIGSGVSALLDRPAAPAQAAGEDRPAAGAPSVTTAAHEWKNTQQAAPSG